MQVQKLFQVLVVAGASTTAGLTACGSSGGGGGYGGGGGNSACNSVCKPSTTTTAWIDCNGCCCWLPIGQTCATGAPICGNEPCCAGNGR